MEKDQKNDKKKKKKKNKALRIFGKILLGLAIFIFLILLFIRSPWGQDIIKEQVISSLAEQTETTIELERLFITFSGNIYLDGLYVEDRQGDTLVYSDKLEAGIPLLPIIRGKGIAINFVDWSGVRANITRQDTIEGFNFSFLAEAFASQDTTATAEPAQDTTATGQEFSLGEINLSDFDVVYNDAVLGIESRYRVGTLKLEMEETDLDSMRFRASNGYIANSIIDYRQSPVPETPQEDPPPMPVFILDRLQIENVAANYEAVEAGMLAEFQLRDFLIELPMADLGDNIIEIDRLQLNQSDILIKTAPTAATTQETPEEEVDTTEGFQWPEWTIALDEISMRDNLITYISGDSIPRAGEFDPNAMEFRNFAFEGSGFYLRQREAGGNLENLSFVESSGINLKNFGFDASLDNNSLSLQELVIDLNNNHIEGDLNIRYNTMEDLTDNPENALVEANLPEFRFNLEDVFLVAPDLRNNEQMVALSRKPVYGELRGEGTLADLQISQLQVNWGQTTSLAARGRLQNPTQPENLRFDFPRIRAVSQRGDIRSFVDEEQMNVTLPQRFTLTANVSGTTEDITAVVNLNSSAGQIALDGNFSSSAGISFNADVEVEELELGTILNNEQLGNLNLTLTAQGEGETVNDLDATMEAVISSFSYNDYPIEDLRIGGALVDGRGPVTMEYKDDNLNVDMVSVVILDTVAPQVNMNLDVIGANLQALGLSQRDIRVAFELDGSFRGNGTAFDINAEIDEGVAVYDDNSYLLGDFGVSARVRPDSTALDVRNQIVEVYLRSNTDPASFAGALDRHFQSYLTEGVQTDTVENPVNLQLRTEVRDNPLLREVFLPGLEEMDTIKVAVDFAERDRELQAEIELPYLVYAGSEIDSLEFHLGSNREEFGFQLGFHALNAGPLNIRETAFVGEVVDRVLHLDFNSYYQDEHLMHIQSEIAQSDDAIIFTLDPSELILNAAQWNVPETNEIRIAENTTYTDFVLTRNNQRLELTDDHPDATADHTAITFQNFRLASILNYLNPEEELATGGLNGNLIFEDAGGATGLIAGLEIVDLNIMEVPMGNLTMNAESTGGDNYSFDMAIKEGNIDLDLTGGYTATEEGAQWDTQLSLNEVQMVVLEAFSQGEITNTDGSFSGNFSLSGTTTEPVYEGNLNFDNAGFTVATLNAPFVLTDESLRLDNEGVYFEDFNLQDQNNNNLTFNGEILTESLLNPSFDVAFEATDFMLLNSTSEDNDLYYGTVVFDANGTLGGNLNVPRVDLNLTVNSETDVTYVIPPSEIGIEERDGVVIFVNRENPDAILTEDQGEESLTLSGFVMNSVITIDEEATFNVIIDEQTGDNLQIIGQGDLNFNIYENGRTTLTGRYVLSGGHYEMNLYGLVNRRFELVEGSTITWAGDPLDANLDVSARYRVETSASSLMAAQTTGAEASVRQRFRQELPFFVYLNVDGEIMEPILSFGLDMPEEEQGAIGGQVYGRVQQLNQQEQELNRQVFSLLVLNRFYPEGTSDGSGGGTMAIARDNLNNALSDQLNMLSNDLLGDSGIQLDFGLDTFTDYQGDAPQERTQLDITASRSFMDERLEVRVGSEVDVQGTNQQPGASTPLIGNVSIEYLITEGGRWRIRGFRRNTFENVIEGQVIASGLALIFSREFNEFSELWGKLDEEEENPDSGE